MATSATVTSSSGDEFFEYYDILILTSNLGSEEGVRLRELLREHRPDLKVDLLEEADFLEQTVQANLQRAMQCALVVFSVITEDWTQRTDTQALFKYDLLLTGSILGLAKATPIPIYVTSHSPSKVPWVKQLPLYVSPSCVLSRAVDFENPTRFLSILSYMLKSNKMQTRRAAILNILKDESEEAKQVMEYEDVKCDLKMAQRCTEHKHKMNELYEELSAVHLENPAETPRLEEYLSDNDHLLSRDNTTAVVTPERPPGQNNGNILSLESTEAELQRGPMPDVIPAPLNAGTPTPREDISTLIHSALTRTHQKLAYEPSMDLNHQHQPFYVGSLSSGDSTTANAGSVGEFINVHSNHSDSSQIGNTPANHASEPNSSTEMLSQ